MDQTEQNRILILGGNYLEIEFELIEKDYINFNINHAKKSPSLNKSIIFIRILGPLVFLIAPFIVVKFSDIPFWYWMTLFSITSIIWLVFYPRYFEWQMRRRIKKILNEGNNENVFKKTKLILMDNGIVQKSANGETNTKWNEVDRVDETCEYIYIYNSSISAHIIPKRIFENEEEMKIFLGEVLKYYNKQK